MSINNSKIIILLAAYNGEKYIYRQIKSILNQSLSLVDILINIDKSQDDTVNIVKKLSEKYPQIQIFESNKKFGSSASNFLYMFKNADFSKCNYVALSDQDDIWNKDKLENAVKKIKLGFSGYSSNVEAFWEKGKAKKVLKSQEQTKYDFLFESAGPGCTFVLTQELALNFQKFIINNESFVMQMKHYHDWLIYAFARANNYKWFIDDYFSLRYRQHSNNDIGVNIGLKAFFKRSILVINGEGIDQTLRLIKLLKLEKDDFVSKWYPITRINFLKLAFYSKFCRRRLRDKFLFLIACLLLSLFYPKKIQRFNLKY